MEKRYEVTGMTCAACSSRVEKSVSQVEGVRHCEVNLLTNSMKVEFENEELDQDIIQAVEDAGYGIASHQDLHKNSQDKDDLKQRLIASIILLILLMFISMHHMFFMMLGIKTPNILKIFMGNENALIFSFTQLLIVLPIIYINRQYYIRGLKNLWHRSPNMDSLVAVGSLSALIYGIIAIYMIGYGLGHQQLEIVQTYRQNLYFESSGMILTLVSLGKYLENRSKKKTTTAIEKLIDLKPQSAILLKNDKQFTISIDDVKVGDHLLVKSGMVIPVDGQIIKGNTSIDESMMSGESTPVDKQVGDHVISATMNLNGTIEIETLKVGDDLTINKMIQLVEEASSSKAPISRLADQIAGVFVPIVMVIALLTIMIWMMSGSTFEFAFSNGISVLVISCPCALGLATPVAIMVATGVGAQNGLMIKSGEALETLHHIDTVVMDKTGTITQGNPKVSDVIASDKYPDFYHYAYSLEVLSEHPLAKAIVSDHHYDPFVVKNYHNVFGQGIEGEIDGESYYGGNLEYIRSLGIDCQSIDQKVQNLSQEGKTVLIFTNKKDIMGMIAVSDMPRMDSQEAIGLLKDMGLRTIMLTGDHELTALAIQKAVGVDEVIAHVLPDQKESVIASLIDEGKKVAMVGDGINDAPALARATVGIAIGAGSDIAIESGDVVLMHSSLLDVVKAIQLSKATIRNIKENLFWAFFYNVICIPLAAGALYPLLKITLNPMIGAAAMSFSSLFVVSNALRLKRIKLTKEKKEMKYELNIQGMMCQHCKKHVHDALASLNHVSGVEVSLEKNNAVITSSDALNEATLKAVIEEAGYELTGFKSLQ